MSFALVDGAGDLVGNLVGHLSVHSVEFLLVLGSSDLLVNGVFFILVDGLGNLLGDLE